tara:strand:- start:908 stop:1435 length:528 start_codon:yes stop_codon:yes gene_type:complete
MSKLIEVKLLKDRLFSEDTNEARDLYSQSRFGEIVEGKVELSFYEALYLLEKKKVKIVDYRNKELDTQSLIKKAQKNKHDFLTKYTVFKDMRNRGYIVKTALKFGADFRVYDRGIKPGEDHAKWVLFPVHEGNTLTWHEFAAKNRVAHSTRKKLLIGAVDDEGDTTYWEISWKRP